MTPSKKYNIWLALCYEITNDLSHYYPGLRSNQIVKLVLRYCRRDWVLWKVASTLDSVDRDVARIQREWDAQRKPTYIYREHAADGSKAQELLGGAMEIKSDFNRQ